MNAFETITKYLEGGKSFVLEAGAGSGKTYTLIQTLDYLIQNYGEKIRRSNQKIACITYTNVAKKEIIDRIDNNNLVLVSTIHEFMWTSIKQYQKQLKLELCKLNEINHTNDISKGKADSRYVANLAERIDAIEKVVYNDTSFNDFENGIIQHDDVIEIAKSMYENYTLLTDIIAERFPYIFVDEYQDTANETIYSLIECLLKRNPSSIILGFYGDSHQKIYDYGVGDLVKHYISNGGEIELVKKEENYRSSKAVVSLLNNFRKNINQIPQRKEEGSSRFIYWKKHPKKPKKDIRKFNEETEITKNALYDSMLEKLKSEGWIFNGASEDKILVLANRRVAQRAGFGNLFEIFSRRFGLATKERLLDRTHPLITFFVGTIDKKTSQERKTGLEHLLDFWVANNQNEVIRFIKKKGTALGGEFKHIDKGRIYKLIDTISRMRTSASVKDLLEITRANGIIYDKRLDEFITKTNLSDEVVPEAEKETHVKNKNLLDSFLSLPYSEILTFWKHIQNYTVFSTKHGTKGDEYRNVLAVIDDTEWPSEYNFKDFFNNSDEIEERKLRTRNLFYVECSRAIDNLVVLCLSELDSTAITSIESWFGKENVYDIEDFIR